MSSVRALRAGQTTLLGETELALIEHQEGRGFKILCVCVCILNLTVIFLRFVETVSSLTCWIDNESGKSFEQKTHFTKDSYATLKKQVHGTLSDVKRFPNSIMKNLI